MSKKQTIIRFLLTLYVFCFLIFPGYLQFRQVVVKTKTEGMLQTDPHYVTTVLKLNQHEYHKLNWLSEHEFYYQNNVYDLFEADSLKNGDFLLSVFCDTEENEILEDMSSHENKKKDGEAFVRILLCTTWYNELNKLEAGLPKVIELFLARNTPEFHTSYGNLSELVHPPPAA